VYGSADRRSVDCTAPEERTSRDARGPLMAIVHALLHRVRWRIFGLLFRFGCIAYLQQESVTVAAARMVPELGLSQMQIGWMESAFLIGYAVFQLPGV
jgi:sugar phosphate permease